MNKASQHVTKLYEVLSVALAAASYLVVFSVSKSLIVTNSDFRTFLLSSVNSREAGQFLPGATADFQRSLGISEYPVGLIFDWPWLAATSVSPGYLQATFAGVTCISLYLAVNLLGARFRVAPFQRQMAGFLLPLLMFVPGPVKWNSIPTYTASFGWTVSTLTISMVAMSVAQNWRWATSALVGLIAGMFVFWANVSYLPMTLPTVIIGSGFIYWQTSDPRTKRRSRTFSVAMLCAAIPILPLFIGVYFFGVWTIPDIAVQENIDTISSSSDVVWSLLPFPGLDNIPVISNWLGTPTPRIITLLILLLSIHYSWKLGQSRNAVLGAVALGIFFIYALAYSLSAWLFSREIGLTPSYIEIIAYPIWLLLILNFVLNQRYLMKLVSTPVLRVMPMVIMLVWVTQWTIQNYSVRLQPAEYPIFQSNTTRELTSLTNNSLRDGDFPRVIILQERFPEERAPEGFRIRRASDFSYSFLLELQAANIPVLNAYSHLISPRTFAITNEFFTDGRPTWRQFSLYDKPNINKMTELGIRYVLSEYQITSSQLKLISVEPFTAYGLFPTEKSAYLYEVAELESHSQSIFQYEFEGDELLISGYSLNRRSVSIPIEFSRCLTLSNPSGMSSPNINRGNYGLVNLTFQGKLDVRLRYENSMFQWRNCRILDYLDFRRQQSTPP